MKNQIKYLTYAIALIASGNLYAQVNTTAGNINGTTILSNQVSLGEDGITLSNSGVSTGHNAIATGNNMTRLDFNNMISNYKNLLDEKKTIETTIKELQNDSGANAIQISTLNNQLNQINQELIAYGNNISTLNNLNNSLNTQETNKADLLNQINNLSTNFDSQKEFLNFYSVLKTLNWGEYQQTNGLSLMGNQLKDKIANVYPLIASKYDDTKYQNIIQGYVNVETLLNTTINNINQSLATGSTSLTQNGVVLTDFYKNINPLITNLNPDYMVNSITLFSTDNLLVENKISQDYVNMLNNYIANVDNHRYGRNYTYNTFTYNNKINPSPYDFFIEQELYTSNNEGDYLDRYFEYMTIHHTGGSIYKSTTSTNRELLALKIQEQALNSANYLNVNYFVDAAIESAHNPLLSQDSSRYDLYLQLSKDAVSLYEQIIENDPYSMVQSVSDAKTKLTPYYNLYKKNIEIIELWKEIQGMADTPERQTKQSQFLAMLEDYNNGTTYNTIVDLRNNDILIPENGQFPLSDGFKNYLKTSTEKYRDYILSKESDLIGYNANDQLIIDLTAEAQQAQDNLNNLNQQLATTEAEIEKLKQEIAAIDVSANEAQLNAEKLAKEQQLADAEKRKDELEQQIVNANNDLNNKITQINNSLTTSGSKSIAIGANSFASGNSSISIGADTTTTADNAVAVGVNSTVTGTNSLSFGSNNNITTPNTTVVGNGNTSTIGYGNVLIGNNINHNIDTNNNVVLGNDSKPAYATQSSGLYINGKLYTFSGTTPGSVVSIGGEGSERQLKNVAAGVVSSVSTDGVNGSQLYAVADSVNDLALNASNIDVATWRQKLNITNSTPTPIDPNQIDLNEYIKYDTNTTSPTVTLRNNTIIKNVGNGAVVRGSKEAVNGGQLFEVKSKVDSGLNFADTKGNSTNMQLGETFTIAGDGKNINTTVSSGKVTVGLANKITVDQVNTGNVSMSADGINAGNKVIQNVADGKIAEGSKEAINGGQIYSILSGMGNSPIQNTAYEQKLKDLDQKHNDLDEKLENAVATSNAIAGMVQATEPGQSLVGISVGGYDNKQAVAIGVSGLSDNGKIIYKLNAGVNLQGKQKASYSGSIGYQF